MYFIAAIIGASFGIVGQVSNVLENEIVGLQIAKIDLNSSIPLALSYFSDACESQERDKVIQEEREREIREGLMKPLQPDKPKFPLFTFYVFLNPSDLECGHISVAVTRLAYTLPRADGSDEPQSPFDRAYFSGWSKYHGTIEECAPFQFTRSPDTFSQYNSQLVASSERVNSICEEISSVSKRLSFLDRLDPVQQSWPLFLGLAFGVRLARVHAEVRQELSMGGNTVNPAFTTLMAKRFHVLYLHILHRLWLRGESDEPYEAHSATDAVRKEKRAEAAE